MRITDLPTPGRFAGSATLRKDICRAIDFAQRASWRGTGNNTPEIVLSLEVCFKAALEELSKLHKGQELMDDPESSTEPDTGTDVPENTNEPQNALQGVSEVVHKENNQASAPALPSILRKRKTK